MKLVPDAAGYDPARCILPGCGQPLYLAYTASQDIYASFTDADLTGCRPHDMESWEVRCLDGHVLLLPPDDGQESHLFGTCVCDLDEDQDHGEGCARGDFARLKAVIDMADSESAGGQ